MVRRRSIIGRRCRKVQTLSLCDSPIVRNTGWVVHGGNLDRRPVGSRAAWPAAQTIRAMWVYIVDAIQSADNYSYLDVLIFINYKYFFNSRRCGKRVGRHVQNFGSQIRPTTPNKKIILIILSQSLYNSSATFYFSVVYYFFTNEEYYYECNINLLTTILVINDTSRKQYFVSQPFKKEYLLYKY